MAEFTPAKKLPSDFNGGQEYKNEDAVLPEDWNNLIESALYTQEQADSAVSSANSVVSLATNQPDTSSANNVGTPTVTIEDTDGGKQFKFANLKGQKGDKGDKGDTGATGATGASSINSALVTNVDGDSEVDTFSQKFIKGGAQAKNYYNLGAYDTFIDNNDGTVTITRQTGYFNPPLTGWLKRTTVVGEQYINSGNFSFADTEYQSSNLYDYKDKNILYVSTDNGFNFSSSELIINDNTVGHTTALIEKIQNMQVQYKLEVPYIRTEKAIINQLLFPMEVKAYETLMAEYKKGLNLADSTTDKSTTILQNNGVYTVPANLSVAWYGMVLSAKLPAGAYAFLPKANTDEWYGRFQINNSANGNDKGIIYVDKKYGNGKFNNAATFVLDNETTIYVYFCMDKDYNWNDLSPASDLTYNAFNFTIMLNSGTVSYYYTPYNGKIIHEKDLSGVQLFPADVNPAQTIGGDWEDKGTVTTNDNTVFHAYRRL